MFESMTFEQLQIYWWVIISVLGGFLVFLLFVQGGQTLFDSLSSTEDDKNVILSHVGHKWETTFTTLVTFGGAFFASFPLFYSTSFGGAYWVWMIILFAFVVQAVSYEYRRKKNNFLGSKTYEWFLKINGYLAPFLLGVAVSTFFTGNMFSVQKERILRTGNNVEAVISRWETPWHGLEALWTWHDGAFIQNILLGLATLFLARILAVLYIRKTVDRQSILAKTGPVLKRDSLLFLVFFVAWLVRLMFMKGFAVDPGTGKVFLMPYKYWKNLTEQPWLFVWLLISVGMVLYGLYLALFKEKKQAFWWTGFGTVFTVMAVFFLAGFHHTAYYPSVYDLQSSLTIQNSSSSRFTLVVMAYVSLLIPFVLAYIAWAWRALDRHGKQAQGKETTNY